MHTVLSSWPALQLPPDEWLPNRLARAYAHMQHTACLRAGKPLPSAQPRPAAGPRRGWYGCPGANLSAARGQHWASRDSEVCGHVGLAGVRRGTVFRGPSASPVDASLRGFLRRAAGEPPVCLRVGVCGLPVGAVTPFFPASNVQAGALTAALLLPLPTALGHSVAFGPPEGYFVPF